jgi:hypothetical protein
MLLDKLLRPMPAFAALAYLFTSILALFPVGIGFHAFLLVAAGCGSSYALIIVEKQLPHVWKSKGCIHCHKKQCQEQ